MIYLLYIALFVLTIVSYLGGVWLFRKTGLSLLHPLLVSVIVVIGVLMFTGTPYEYYQAANMPIDFLLGPTVVALGYALYEQREHLLRHWKSILVSIFVGATVGILSVVGILRLFGSNIAIVASIVPKSVTNPIAIPIAERTGGIGALTAVVVVMTGILGGIIGPPILKALKIESKIAKGLALGSATHGVGTARAMEIGALEGAIAGLAIGLMGLVTALLVPIFEWLL